MFRNKLWGDEELMKHKHDTDTCEDTLTLIGF